MNTRAKLTLKKLFQAKSMDVTSLTSLALPQTPTEPDLQTLFHSVSKIQKQ